MIRSRPKFRLAAFFGLSLMLASCGQNEAPTPSATESSTNSSYQNSGTFKCDIGKPWRAFQVAETAEVAPGATAKIVVHGPPAMAESITAAQIGAYCSVDGQSCVGTSCGGHPPVDFLDDKGKGPSWEIIHSTDGSSQMVFTAHAHNTDSEPHQVTLMIDLPAN